MRKGLSLIVILITLLIVLAAVSGCDNGGAQPTNYTVSGRVSDANKKGVEGVSLVFSGDYGTVMTDKDGRWSKTGEGVTGPVTVTPVKEGWSFVPASITLTRGSSKVDFEGTQEGRIVFISERDRNADVFLMSPTGNVQVNLTNSGEDESDPCWSPDGTKIAYVLNIDDENSAIYVMNPDGSGKIKLTKEEGINDSPIWSPDGKKIAYIRMIDGDLEIFVMNADGTDSINISNNGLYDMEPQWSPDGTKILYTSFRGANPEIYIVNADGSEQKRLTNSPGADSSAVWSPDGTKIAFLSTRDDNSSADEEDKIDEIYIMNADGSEQKRLTNQYLQKTPPKWSPDGKKIAYSTYSKNPSIYDWKIYVMNADGTDSMQYGSGNSYDRFPCWSPDGKRLLFITLNLERDEITYDFKIMDSDGSNIFKLTNNYVDEYSPSWSKF